MDAFPGKAHAVERARSEILHQHIAGLHQTLEDFLAPRILGIDRDRALVMVQHREIEGSRRRAHVAQLAARRIAHAGAFHLDNIGAEPGEKLRAGRARLDMGKIEDAHAFQRLAVEPPRFLA